MGSEDSETVLSAGDLIQAQYRTRAGYITDEWYRGFVKELNSDGTYKISFGSHGEGGYWWDAPRQHIRAGPIHLLGASTQHLKCAEGSRTIIVRTLDGVVLSRFHVSSTGYTLVWDLKQMVGKHDTPPRAGRFLKLLYGDWELREDQTLWRALGDDKAIADITCIRTHRVGPCGECDLSHVCGGCGKVIKYSHDWCYTCREPRCESPPSCTIWNPRWEGKGKGKGWPIERHLDRDELP